MNNKPNKILKLLAFNALLLSISFGLALAQTKTFTPTRANKPDSTIVLSFWKSRYDDKTAYLKHHQVNLLFVGDSITHFWDAGKNQASWIKYYDNRNAYDIGISGARTETILWMLDQGMLSHISPKLVVLLIGTNNIDPRHFSRADSARETASGIDVIVSEIGHQLPNSKILLLGIFHRGDQPKLNSKIDQINERIAREADGKHVFFLNIDNVFLNADSTVNQDLMYDLIHPTPQGYEVWAKAMEPAISNLLGDN